MVLYSLFNAALDFIALACTVVVVIWNISNLQPLFERVRDSCRACQYPKERVLLLRSVVLIHVVCLAVVALYFRNLFSFWDLMGTLLEDQSVNRPLYAVLHLCLFFLLGCGAYGWVITISEVFQSRQVFKDLFMIARFNTRRYQAVEELEAQLVSPSMNPINARSETPLPVNDMRHTNSLSHDEGSRMNGQDSNEDDAPVVAFHGKPEHGTEVVFWPGLHSLIGKIFTRSVHSPVRYVEVKILTLRC